MEFTLDTMASMSLLFVDKSDPRTPETVVSETRLYLTAVAQVNGFLDLATGPGVSFETWEDWKAEYQRVRMIVLMAEQRR